MAIYRRHGRTPLRCAVKLEHHETGEVIAEIRDVSATGVFVRCKELASKLTVGDEVTAQIDATQENMEFLYNEGRQNRTNRVPSQFTVVRLTEDGVGLVHE